jgi:hypothetical protein
MAEGISHPQKQREELDHGELGSTQKTVEHVEGNAARF